MIYAQKEQSCLYFRFTYTDFEQLYNIFKPFLSSAAVVWGRKQFNEGCPL